MKQILTLPALFLWGILSLTGCLKDTCEATRVYIQFDPIYLTIEQLRQQISAEAPRTLKNPGKIYVIGDYLLINELHEGIHIIDNKDPRNPVNLSFISIPGNIDMAVRGNLLYADSYIDLVTINIENPAAPVFVRHTENVFQPIAIDPNRGLLVGYRETEVREKAPCDFQNNNWFWRGESILVSDASLSSFYTANKGNVSGPSVNGIGGSMARFTLYQKYLYTVDNSDLRVFDLGEADKPQLANRINIGWGIETIFPYQDKLFIGSTSGMFIFDNKNPLQPSLASSFQHARSCDPVFVENDIAYVTLHGGTPCGGFTNQLDILDVKNIFNPVFLKSHPLHRPHGLSVVNKVAYICEDDQGLKIFDASDWKSLKLLSHVKGFQAYDVIVLSDENLAIVTGKEGLHQFDVSNPNKVEKMSTIAIAK